MDTQLLVRQNKNTGANKGLAIAGGTSKIQVLFFD